MLPLRDARKIRSELSKTILAPSGDQSAMSSSPDVVRFNAIRPGLITGIPGIAKQGDLVDRTISITLPEFGADARRTEGGGFRRVR